MSPTDAGRAALGEARPTANTHTEWGDMELTVGWLGGRVPPAVVRDPGRVHP